MPQDDIKPWLIELNAFAARLERGCADAQQALEHTTQNGVSALRQARQAEQENFKKDTARALQSIESATQALMQQILAAKKAYATYAWKAFIACAVGSVMVIGAAVYTAVKSHQEISRTEWISQINAAIAHGKLGVCPQGEGLCAYVDKRALRLDK